MANDRPAMIELEPAPGSAPTRRPWEVLLGVALLLAVLGYAGGDWWRTEQAAGAYRQGQAAAVARHWDAAAQAFAVAGDYADAAQRRAAAVAQVQRRDDLLRQATQAARPGLAFQALEQAAAVAPDYPGLADRLRSTRQQLFAQGPRGTIFLRTGGGQPGLYLLRAGAPEYLPGSDARSRVRGIATGGLAVLYDRAGGGAPGACLLPCAPGARQVVLAHLDGDRLATQVVGGRLYPDGSGTFAGDTTRFWWQANGAVWYVDLAAPQVADVLGGRAGWRVLALDPARGRLLLAGPPADSASGPALYLARAAGQEAQALPPGPSGIVFSAAFSADGAYLLYLAQQDGATPLRTVWRIDLRAPATSLSGVEWLSWQGAPALIRLGAFLPPAARSDDVLVNRLDEHGDEIARIDLRTGRRQLLWTGAGRELRTNTAALSPDGQSLVVHDPQGSASTLVLIPLAGDTAPQTFPAPTYNGQTIHAAFAPAGDYILYEVRNPAGMNRGYTQALYTLPAGAPAGTRPTLLTAQVAMPNDRTLPTLALPPGGDLLLYVTATGELEAGTFDGAAHLPLDTGVAAVWSLRDPTPWAWAR